MKTTTKKPAGKQFPFFESWGRLIAVLTLFFLLTAAPLLQAMPIPSTNTSEKVTTCHAGGFSTEWRRLEIGVSIALVGGGATLIASYLWLDANDQNNNLGAIWFNYGIILVLGGIMYVNS